MFLLLLVFSKWIFLEKKNVVFLIFWLFKEKKGIIEQLLSMFSSPYSHISLPVVSSPKWNPFFFFFFFFFFWNLIFFLFEMGLWESFLSFVIQMGYEFFFILSGVFCFFHLDVEKIEEREGKEFDKSRIFLGLFCSRERNRVFFLALCLQVWKFLFHW